MWLRREPTSDLEATKPGWRPTWPRLDLVGYADEALTVPRARWRWDQNHPRRGLSRVIVNCFSRRAVWLPDLEDANHGS